MRNIGSILVIRRDNIGDLACTTPLLAALRKRYPHAWIGVLANSYNAPVLVGNPSIDSVYAYRKLKHIRRSGALAALAERISMLWALRRRRLDLVILAAGAQDERGEKLAKLLAPGRILRSEPEAAGGHEVERAFTAARILGIEDPIPVSSVMPAPAALARAGHAIQRAGLKDLHPLIGVHISARRVAQRWPAAHFAELIVALNEKLGSAAMLFWSPGNEDDRQHPGDDAKAKAIVEVIGRKAPWLAYPTLALEDLIGGLAQCDAVICSDGGAMHLAAALGKPIVCFFGDSPVERWRPWGVRHTVLQGTSRRVADISVETAVNATYALLHPWRSASGSP